MSEWRWYCSQCNRDLGPMVGKHLSTCPDCKTKNAYATNRGPDRKKKVSA